MMRKFLHSKYLLLYCLSILVLLIILGYFIFRNDLALWAYGETSNRNGELLKDFLSIIGGVLVIAGLYLSFIRAKSFERSVEKQDHQIANQTKGIELTRTSLINDQFKNAVSHLGDAKEPIILGGIAELFELAKNNKDYRELVSDILSSFIRSEALYKKSYYDINSTLIEFALEKLISPIFKDFKKNLAFSNLEILAIKEKKLTNFTFDNSKFFSSVDSSTFTNCSLKYVKISQGNISYVNFIDTDLYGVLFENIHFQFCSFDHLYGSSIIDSAMYFCKINGSIRESNLFFNIIEDSKFGNGEYEDFYTHIESSNFSGSRFKNCEFMNAKIVDNNFDICQILKIDFQKFIGNNSMKGAYSEKMLDTSNKHIVQNRLNKPAEIENFRIKKVYYSMLNTGIFDENSANKLISKYNRIIAQQSLLKSKEMDLIGSILDK